MLTLTVRVSTRVTMQKYYPIIGYTEMGGIILYDCHIWKLIVI